MTTKIKILVFTLTILLVCCIIVIISSSLKGKLVEKAPTKKAIADSSFIALNKTPKIILDKLDSICKQLDIKRLSDTIAHTPDILIRVDRITYLPGCCFCPLSNQGICISFIGYISPTGVRDGDEFWLSAYHFQYSQQDGIKIDTVFKTLRKQISSENYNKFSSLISGAYLNDQVEYSAASGGAPDYFFIERFNNDYNSGPTVEYNLNVKGIIRPNSNFTEMINYGMGLAKIKWRTWEKRRK